MEILKRYCRNKTRVFMMSCIVLLLVVILLLGFLLFEKPTDTTSRMTSFGLREIGELATQAGYFTSVQVIQDAKDFFGISLPFTEKKYVFSYDGTVKAGVDFKKISMEIVGNEIHVRIPEAEIFGVQVDPESYTIYYEGESIFNKLKIEDVNEAQKALEEEVREKAVANGILENAMNNARMLITGYLSAIYDLNEYSIVFE